MVEIQKIEKNLWYVCTRNEYTGDYPDGDLTFKEGFAYKGEDILKEYSEDEIQKYYLRSFRLWTVQDAKPGDFLTYSSEDNKDWYLIYYSEYVPYENHYHYYACYTDKFYTGGTACIDADYLHPSTSKERNILLQKIEEAGYCWDAENQKLTKITEEVAEKPTAPRNGSGKRMKVITLCGSTRFKEQFLEQQKRLTLEGNIVISVGLFGHSRDEEVWKPGTKEMLDKMHLQKIDMADEIFVINVGGYIGDSTRREIAYAEKSGKTVRFLEHFEALGNKEAKKDSEELTHSATKISDSEEPANDYVLGGTKSNKSWGIHPGSIPHNEEPANEDLEKEIDRWSQEQCYNKSEKPVFAAVARHFAKWQKEIDKLIFYNDLSKFADIKKLVVNEIASINTIETIDTDFDGWYNRLIVFAKRCAQWQKQQMMKSSIDAHIVLGPNNNHVLMNGRFNKFKWNDKVKIIIIEEDKI